MKQLLFNQNGGSAVKTFSIILIFLLLLGGGLGIYYQYFNKETFTEEEIAAATEVAQQEFDKASSISQEYTVSEQATAITSLGYEENKRDKSTIIYEKKSDNESDYFILFNVQPHESYQNLSQVLIQIFDKENGSLMYELDNVLTWKE
nr:hypothetical protein [Lysinibacillus timonensis]